MTSWSVPGSTVRYWQCPFCSRTHSSHYGEVFAHGAGARRVEPHAPTSAAGPPQAGPDEIRWTRLKARAARWFQRLEQEQAPAAPRPPSGSVNTPRPAAPSPAAALRAPVPARRSR